MDITAKVKENLLFYNLWTEISEINIPNEVLLEGTPKEPLLNDDKDATSSELAGKEIVFPVSISEKVTPRRLDSIFDGLQEALGIRPKRVVTAIVNDDSTVVYYFIHDGVYKPKRN